MRGTSAINLDLFRVVCGLVELVRLWRVEGDKAAGRVAQALVVDHYRFRCFRLRRGNGWMPAFRPPTITHSLRRCTWQAAIRWIGSPRCVRSFALPLRTLTSVVLFWRSRSPPPRKLQRGPTSPWVARASKSIEARSSRRRSTASWRPTVLLVEFQQASAASAEPRSGREPKQ